eukprot:TRINITY_DN63172_c0_g1_i1.p1 TRINITY_DN63172_c0_g1~~TRINITY_DN63172_c0_g1_i1.p1  ORF type:complete len:922 (+),score=309.01 TRINITY_DN63172_c0_g1_i1:67-2766(+)
MEQDPSTQLRHQIAQATSEKEQAKLDLEALRRTVDSHLLRLNSILGGGEVSFERLSSAIQALDSELRGRLDGGGSAGRDTFPAEGTYEVLRQSLSEAQKRCQDLNNDMLRVADANEELHSTLKSLKGTNRRLVEEVQKQTEELSNLTQQRLLDMEKLSKQEEVFGQEKALWAQEAQRSLEDEQKRLDEDFCSMRDVLTSQLDSCWRKAASASHKTELLRSSQLQVRSEVQDFQNAFSQGLKSLERDLLARIADDARQMQNEQNQLQDMEHNLQVKLKAEKEVRANEADGWRSRQKALASELDDLISRRDREVSELQSKVDAAVASREAEEAAARQERSAMQDKAELLVKDVALVEAMVQTARRKSAQLEARLSTAQSERDRLKASADTLRQQVKESDDALAEAMRSNEALRDQMELQRLDAHSANERELKLCQEMYARRLEGQAQSHEDQQAELSRRIRNLEDTIGLKAGKVQASREALAEKSKVRESLQRDVQMWKAQHELAYKMKADVEREFAQFKQECLGKELREKQELHEELMTKQADLEEKKSRMEEEARRLDAEFQARETADSQRAQSVAELRREVMAEAERTKANLAEVESALAAAKAEAAAVQQQLSERKDSLEQELTRITAESDSEKRELERKIQAERASCESLRESLERLRQEQHGSYKASLEGPQQQIVAVEGSILEIQQAADLELSGLRQKSEKLRLRSEELEAELVRLQAKLSQTEQEVQEGAARLNVTKATSRETLENLQKEKARKSEELKQVQRAISQKTERLRATTQAGEDIRSRLQRDIGDAKAARARHQAEAEATQRFGSVNRNFQRLTEPATALEDMNVSRDASHSRMDSLLRENDDLKRCISEQRLTTSHLQDIGSRMQRSLNSMEDRAADLRYSLQRS